jgi:imidazolonepropionase-like amidohydrolase
MTTRTRGFGPKRAFAFAGLLTLAVAPLLAQAPALQPGVLTQPGQEVVIRGGWLYDGVKETRTRNTGIIVRSGKFFEVGAQLDGRTFPGAHVVDLDDNATIMPGMFDLHAHHRLGGTGRPGDDTRFIPIFNLANGVTSVFPAGELSPEAMLVARRRIDSGKQIGARIFGSGPYFGAAANQCPGVKTYKDECVAWPNKITEQEIRDKVDYWAERGIRSIKVKQASPEELRVVIEQAHKHGLSVTAHLHNYASRSTDVSIRDAILMGIDRVEHSLVDQADTLQGRMQAGTPEFEEQAKLFLAHNVYIDSTMWLYGRWTILADPKTTAADYRGASMERFFTPYQLKMNKQRSGRGQVVDEDEDDRINGEVGYTAVFKDKGPQLLQLYKMGGGHLITTGTDGGSGFNIHQELLALEYAGLPRVAVLRAATINGANALGVGSTLGTIEAGKIADLYIVNGNPLEDLRVTRAGRFVMKAGELYDPAALLKSVEGKIGQTAPAGRGAAPSAPRR